MGSSISVQFIIGAICMIVGIIFYIIQFIGVFRYKYILNRMHAAAIGDTLGSGGMMLGIIILNGVSWASLKLIVIVVFLWFTAPVSSHILARMEVFSKKDMKQCAEVIDITAAGEEQAEPAEAAKSEDDKK